MYKLATGKDQGIAKEGEFEVEEEEEEVVKKRIPQEGDSCPICCKFHFISLSPLSRVRKQSRQADHQRAYIYD